MLKLVIITSLLLLSLLIFFKAPINVLWYVSILITEFPWLFILLVLILIMWPANSDRLKILNAVLGAATVIILLIPYIKSWQISKQLRHDFAASIPILAEKEGPPPFGLSRVFTGLAAMKVPFQTLLFDTTHRLMLDFYQTKAVGQRPCVIVIHGGAWAAGDSRQLNDLASDMAGKGYQVACINYRLAPRWTFPAPVEDVLTAQRFLKKNAASLNIDATQFVLLGRSAGGQIALVAAYGARDPSIKGVINFYGPTDMIWGYQNPTNPLVLNSKKVMEDYLGGTPDEVPLKYMQGSATIAVSKKAPPTLLIYGGNDPLVSPVHGTRLRLKLKEYGIPHFELYLPWATHGFDFTLTGPGGQLSTWTVDRFLGAVTAKK